MQATQAEPPPVAVESPSTPPDVVRAGASYEFDAGQNRVIGRLGNNMTWVGIYLIVIGLFGALIGIRQVIHGRANAPILLIYAALQLAIGFWTRGAAMQFNQVAATSEADVPHLMAALEELRRIYGLQKIVIIAALALMGAAVVIALLAAPAR